MSVLLETTKGNIVIDLWYKTQPLLSLNFLKLCQLNYYFFSPFHSFEKDHLVLNGNRVYPQADPCFAINHYLDISPYGTVGDYLTPETKLKLTTDDDDHSEVGIVSFLVNEDGVIGSQFTISLSVKYEASTNQIPFGKVMEGFTTLQELNSSKVDDLIRITHCHILYDPFSDVKVPNSVMFSTESPSIAQLSNMHYYESSLQLLDETTP
ncbi:Peptidyl-prolyl cis-trans isomerase cyp6 [Scheffersomyces spartinae]|uniref:Peptidyl-prolyl cis-trans isomerase cyp6 n=1 Tax=Scheffersomyces spartinae TaxID=45513 RepID=A0A9P8AGV8_9ASCO|nr:Peptidyl-prolyl cis-trans isomerase cyp6 [Scheffersomyces spartinae]KAG7191845.1 Peptidyl-prolyl cis-trans isomerase cyp6 [Scheffersomyces spartinae]